MISIKKIQELLALHFDANGYQRTSAVTDSHPIVLTEFWSLVSTDGFAFFIGFENWDEFESVGLSSSKPQFHEKNEWIETVLLNKTWKKQYINFLREIAILEIEYGK